MVAEAGAPLAALPEPTGVRQHFRARRGSGYGVVCGTLSPL